MTTTRVNGIETTIYTAGNIDNGNEISENYLSIHRVRTFVQYNPHCIVIMINTIKGETDDYEISGRNIIYLCHNEYTYNEHNGEIVVHSLLANLHKIMCIR